MQPANVSPSNVALLQFDVAQRERDEALLRCGKVLGGEDEGRVRAGSGGGGAEGADGSLLHGAVDEVA